VKAWRQRPESKNLRKKRKEQSKKANRDKDKNRSPREKKTESADRSDTEGCQESSQSLAESRMDLAPSFLCLRRDIQLGLVERVSVSWQRTFIL